MLPSANRMRRSADFAAVVRAGSRARRGSVVLHRRADLTSDAPIVGFVVGRSVGGSVVRHQVTRRLRAQVALRLDAFPQGSGTVVRALPEAATASSADLAADLAAGLQVLASRQ